MAFLYSANNQSWDPSFSCKTHIPAVMKTPSVTQIESCKQTFSMGSTPAFVKFNRALLTFLVLVVIYETVLADLISKPLDSESRVNESTYFNCSSSITTKEIHWHHYPVGVQTHERKSVYAFGQFYREYMEDFELDKNSSIGVYNLVIRSVKPNYSGRYECQDNGEHGNLSSAQLIVLESNPDCVSNINSAGAIGPNGCGIPPEDLHLSCSVDYRGNIPPELKWRRVGENDSISDNVTKEQSANRITYNVTVRANLLVDNSSYQCQTTKSITSKHSCTSETLKLLYVIGTSSTSEKAVSEVVHCSANTNSQFCQYKWKWFNREDSLTLSENGTLKVQRTGQHRCEATCNLRNIKCTVNASLINAHYISNNGFETTDSSGSSSTGVVVGLLVAVLLVVIGVAFLGLFFIRRRRSNKQKASKSDVECVRKSTVGNSSQGTKALFPGSVENSAESISFRKSAPPRLSRLSSLQIEG